MSVEVTNVNRVPDCFERIEPGKQTLGYKVYSIIQASETGIPAEDIAQLADSNVNSVRSTISNLRLRLRPGLDIAIKYGEDKGYVLIDFEG